MDAKFLSVQSEVKILVVIVIILVIILIIPIIFVFRVVVGGVLLLGLWLCRGELRSDYSSSDKQSSDNNETFEPGSQLNIEPGPLEPFLLEEGLLFRLWGCARLGLIFVRLCPIF